MRAPVVAVLVAASVALAGGPSAGAVETLRFRVAPEPKPAATPSTFTTVPGIGPGGAASTAAALGLPAQSAGAEAERLVFRTTKADAARLRDARRAARLRDLANEASIARDTAVARRMLIEQLLAEAEADEVQVRQVVEQRLVAAYRDGGGSELAFLARGDGVSDLRLRASILRNGTKADARLHREYAATVARLEQLQLALDDVTERAGDRAASLEARATDIESRIQRVQKSHMEAPVPVDEDDGIAGVWFVSDGAFAAPLFMPTASGGYTGGTRTPRRAATPDQIVRVLSDARIEFDSSGISDVRAGAIDGRLLDALTLLAAQHGRVIVTSLKSDHGTYTSGGNVSMHSYGCAADIGTVGTTYIQPAAQTPGGEVERAVRFLMALPGDLAPHQVISLFDLGGASLSMGDHGDHIHLGYAC